MLTAALAVLISVLSTVLTQYNLDSDRDVQKRARLTALIQQLPAAAQTLREKPDSGVDGLLLVAGDAAELMSEIESSSFEKIEVAALTLLAQPSRTADSPLMRRYQSALTEALWAEDEFGSTQNCVDAKTHFANAENLYGPLVTSPSVKPGLDNDRNAIEGTCK